MSVSPQWRFVLANSNDLSHVGELKNASGRSLTLTLNRAGAASFSLPMSDDLAQYIWPFTSSIKCYRKGSDGAWTLIWSGMVWTITEDLTTSKMTINAVGWLQVLEKRLLRRIKDYTVNNPATGLMWKDFEIIYDLLAEANTTLLTWDTPASHPAGYPVPIIAGANPATPTLLQQGVASGDFSTHGRQLKIDKYANVISTIQQLTDIENGCDIEVHPGTRALNIWSSKMVDNPNAIFAFGGKTAANLSSFSRQLDPSTVVNYLAALGQDNTVAPRFADTTTFPAPTTNPPKLGENSMASYGLIEETQALSSAKNSEILATYAGGEILLRSSPHVIYTMTPFPWTSDIGKGRVPEPFIDYTTGTKVYLRASYHGRFDIRNQGMRVFGITVTPDDQGNEIIGELQIAP